jgi:opacity protein-like surface antigen
LVNISQATKLRLMYTYNMKQLLIIIALLFSFTLYGQETNTLTTTKKTHKLLIGFNFSADIGYRLLKYDRADSHYNGYRNDNEKPNFGYTSGLNIKYNISKKIGFEIGAQYSKKGYTTKKETLLWDYAFPSSDLVNENGLFPNKFKQNFNYHYIDIPLRVIFSSDASKVQFITSIGITTNLLIKANSPNIYYYKDGSIKRQVHNKDNYKKINITPTISAGIAYQLSDKLKLNIEPTYRFGLLKTSSSTINEYLWSVGLNITCYYTLK